LQDENPNLVILNLVHKQITLSIIDAIKEYNVNLPIFWVMHDLITICPAYTMLDGNGNICEKCSQGNFKPCVENKCIKNSRLMSMLSKYEADYIRKKKWYDKVDLYICPSEFYSRKLQDAKFTTSKIVTMRNPLPVDTKYELDYKNEGYFLFFGRLSKEKGIKTLVEAAKITGCRLIILGTGPIEDELKEYAKDLKNVKFEGFKTGNELKEFIRKSLCVVLPSEWYENCPYSAMEAMAMGKPLIVSDNGGLPELVEDGKNGYVYSAKGGAEALAKCIQKINKLNWEKYSEMMESSLDSVKELFEPTKYVQELENAIKDQKINYQD
jgi:glycosyltransferase involved in cell wall biosynthesis